MPVSVDRHRAMGHATTVLSEFGVAFLMQGGSSGVVNRMEIVQAHDVHAYFYYRDEKYVLNIQAYPGLVTDEREFCSVGRLMDAKKLLRIRHENPASVGNDNEAVILEVYPQKTLVPQPLVLQVLELHNLISKRGLNFYPGILQGLPSH